MTPHGARRAKKSNLCAATAHGFSQKRLPGQGRIFQTGEVKMYTFFLIVNTFFAAIGLVGAGFNALKCATENVRQGCHRKEAFHAGATHTAVGIADKMMEEVFLSDPEGRIAALRLTPDARHLRWLTDDALESARSVCSGALCDEIQSEQQSRKRVRAMTDDDLAKLLEESCARDISDRCDTGLREENRRTVLTGFQLKERPPDSTHRYAISDLGHAMAGQLLAWDREGRIAGLQATPDGRHLAWLTDDALDAARSVCTAAVCDLIQAEQEARKRVRALTTVDLEKQLKALCAGGDGRVCEAGVRELHRREVVVKPPS